VGVNAWERWGEKATVWRREEGDNRWETRGYKYPQIWNKNDYFRKPGTSGLDPGTSRNRRLQQADLGATWNFWEKLKGSGKEVFKAKAAN
jgi:hypothetical protein